jgi:twitching motility protein PilT
MSTYKNREDDLLAPIGGSESAADDDGSDFLSEAIAAAERAAQELQEARDKEDQSDTKLNSFSEIEEGVPAGVNAASRRILLGQSGDSRSNKFAGYMPAAAMDDEEDVDFTPTIRQLPPDIPANVHSMLSGDVQSLDATHIDDLLRLTGQVGGSDLHLSVGLPPMVRKDGKIIPLPYEEAGPRDIQRLVYDILTSEQIQKFERTKELDFSYGVQGLGRYRFNVYRQRGSVGAAMRVIPHKVPSITELRLPPIIRELVKKQSGLILVTGPTGSGKSTTIASMIDLINTERKCHIMTIEDPIEYLHSHKGSMVNQRELGLDTDSFANALRAVLREDPDVVLVGEMRDLETIAAAMTLAETGHLVFATLHTRCASATIDRIVDVFPSHQQDQIRVQMSTSLQAVVSQQLMPRQSGGRAIAVEVMIATSAVRNLIREGKAFQLNSVIETGMQFGMQSMDRVLANLHLEGVVSFDEAANRAIDKENFVRLLKGI